jgi:tetratricopeptide (TPR) repeat protein
MPMKHQPLAVALLSLLATAVAAQDDRIVFVDGKVVTGARVDAFDIRSLRYNKSGRDETASADQVAKVELAKFKEVYRRGIRDADMMLTVAREQLAAKETLMAQFGFVGAAAQFFDTDRAPEGVATLDELAKSIPEAGVLPEVYRQKFEYYMGLGGRGASSALQVAKKYQNDAIGGAWPTGLSIEAEFFVALADRGTPAEFQNKLRGIVSKAGGIQPLVANRANIELAHSLRETKDYDGATRIYEDVAKRDGADGSSRAGAYLGLGKILLEQGSASGKDAFKQAMLYFLRVRLETRDAWPAQHAEALYHAVLAAGKWQGPEYQYIMARCRGVLLNEFKGTEWAELARTGR